MQPDCEIVSSVGAAHVFIQALAVFGIDLRLIGHRLCTASRPAGGASLLLRKRVTSVLVVVAVGVVGLVGGASAKQPVATASKVCSAAARERGDVTARTPGGVKCLGPGEYCSHRRGYAKAYREAGFRCNSKGRLEYD
jgi:hypothetical protein